MVKAIDLRLLSSAARDEIIRVAGINDEERAFLRERGEPVALLEIADRYKVSRFQQKKAHAILNDISAWSGYTPMEITKEMTKIQFLDEEIPTLDESFSLANCSREIATKYITFLINFCVYHGIECGEPLWKMVEDIPRYIYVCAINKKCCVCGKKAELHHVQAVGMGNNRHKINHIGRLCLPICRHHHVEAHTMGNKDFCEKYLIQAIPIDEDIRRRYHLNRSKEWSE